jgi:prolyl-tRNA synthetase
VPLRLELGPRDLAAGTALLASRLGGEKTAVALESAPAWLSAELDDFHAQLLQRATDFREQRTGVADSWPEFDTSVADGWARAFHCGRPECEDDIKAATTATARVVPADAEPEQGSCVRCGQPSAYGKRIVFGRAY